MSKLKGWHSATEHGFADPAPFDGFEIKLVRTAHARYWSMRCPRCFTPPHPNQRWHKPPAGERRWDGKHQWMLRDQAIAHTREVHPTRTEVTDRGAAGSHSG